MKSLEILPTSANSSEFAKETQQNPSFVRFYHPGCPHCVHMKPAWENLKNHDALKDMNVAIINIHVAVLGELTPEIQELMQDKGVPSMFLIDNGTITEYNGPRETDSMAEYIVTNTKSKSKPKSTHKKTRKNKKKTGGKKKKNGRKSYRKRTKRTKRTKRIKSKRNRRK